MEILLVECGKFGAVKDQEVLGVSLLSGDGKIKAAGNDVAGVEDHDFVVRDGVLRVDAQVDAGSGEESVGKRRKVLKAFVEDDDDGHAALLGADDSSGDEWLCNEIGLDVEGVSGDVDVGDNEISAGLAGGEAGAERCSDIRRDVGVAGDGTNGEAEDEEQAEERAQAHRLALRHTVDSAAAVLANEVCDAAKLAMARGRRGGCGGGDRGGHR